MSRYLIGVDVGGTFTDIFLLDTETGAVATAKTPSTLDDQSRGFVAGIAGLVEDFSQIAAIVHGTTTGTNALLERKGAKTGIITTEGFRDVLEMRRRDRPTTWGLWGNYEPVVPRNLRRETPERVLADGRVLEGIDAADVAAQARALMAEGCEAVCIFFINSYANQVNERAAVEAVRAVWPNAHVTAAAEILPEIREFERLSTATLNAYLQPLVSEYVDRLDHALRARQSGGDLLIVQSNGGLMTVETTKRQPVRTALSGPAAGVTAAREIAAAAGFANVITCDMGGTSFDVSLIAEGEAALAAQNAVDFGMTIRMPMIEITTIGAGGGSIAGLDASGLLQVGPESAGSMPGPVCYGQGGTRPTVTDANLVLGRINPERPIGGGLERLDVDASRDAIAAHVGTPLGLSPEAAAEAMIRVANAKMAGAIRLVSIERGHDPARFAAMPFGGGGSLHTGALMLEVGLDAALIPRFPGVTSALGCVVADMRYDRVQTVNAGLANADFTALQAAIADVEAGLSAQLTEAGTDFEAVDRAVELDMLYEGQTHTVAVPISAPDTLDEPSVRAAFEGAYRATYGRILDGAPARIVNLRVTVIGRRRKFDMTALAPKAGRCASDCLLGMRRVFCAGAFVDAPVYDRLSLAIGERIGGPALLEQADTTIFIDPGLAGEVDGFGNLILRREG